MSSYKERQEGIRRRVRAARVRHPMPRYLADAAERWSQAREESR